MYKIVKRISHLQGVKNDGVFLPTSAFNWILSLKNFAGLPKNEANKDNLGDLADELTFLNFLEQRQEQARRSAVVKINSYSSWSKVVYFCSRFGKINQVFHYFKGSNNYLLIEMSTIEELQNFMDWNENSKVSSKGFNHFFVFPNSGIKEFFTLSKKLEKVVAFNYPLKAKINLIDKYLKTDDSVSKQIMDLYDVMKLNELGIRLRFLTCRQMEVLFSGMVPSLTVYPFGSSVTGLGLNGCDLDIVATSVNKCSLIIPGSFDNPERFVMKEHIQTVGKVIESFLVGCDSVFCIKHASVPIVKYKQQFADVDCDLSLYSSSGIVSSQMLYSFGLIDKYLRPLFFIVKIWAVKMGICRKQPSPSISSFSLTLLVIFFLQQKTTMNISRLPCWDIFPNRNEVLIQDSKVLSHLAHSKQNLPKSDKSLEELLYLFFQFYENFNFEKYGISLRTGKEISNKSGRPLYVENPLDPVLNVSRNVSLQELIKFVKNCSESRKVMEENDTLKLINLLLQKGKDLSQMKNEPIETIINVETDRL